MHICVFTSLYPNAYQPHHGIFVENRLRHFLNDTKGHRATVIAPVPYMPFKIPFLNSYHPYVNIPFKEERHGVTIYHPRFLVIPKISWYISPWLMYLGAKSLFKKLHQLDSFDLIDAHYFYPDGVAASFLAQQYKLPLTVTARGSDITELPHSKLPYLFIQKTLKSTSHAITVCEALKIKTYDLFQTSTPITTLRNGIDLKIFNPTNSDINRSKLNMPKDKKILLSVGHLIKRKANELTILALAHLASDYLLYLIGSGPEENNLKSLIQSLNLQDRVIFISRVPHDELRYYYSAADCLILASSREGWPNVLLEAMACGCPVIGSSVDGIPEIITNESKGLLLKDRTPEAIVESVKKLFASYPDREKIVKYAQGFSWLETSLGQERIFTQIVNNTAHKAGY